MVKNYFNFNNNSNNYPHIKFNSYLKIFRLYRKDKIADLNIVNNL